jgi:hypothetical protein
MPLIVTVNTIAECPRTDCNIYWEKKKSVTPCVDLAAEMYQSYSLKMAVVQHSAVTIKWHFNTICVHTLVGN